MYFAGLASRTIGAIGNSCCCDADTVPKLLRWEDVSEIAVPFKMSRQSLDAKWLVQNGWAKWLGWCIVAGAKWLMQRTARSTLHSIDASRQNMM